MFIKKLLIDSKEGNIRTVNFHKGINLIVDKTSPENIKETGNNIGKTTVLKLIDFCLGADAKGIYTDPESKKEISSIKQHLIDQEFLITLVLKKDLMVEDSQEILIERNFLSRNRKIMKINGINLPKNEGKDFEKELNKILIGDRENSSPSFRQIIAHNIRYSDDRINNTLKVLGPYASHADYEALYLFMFGIEISDRTKIIKQIKVEKEFKKRLEKNSKRTELELKLEIIKKKIEKLEADKKEINVNLNYENDLIALNNLKYQISKVSSKISQLVLRKNLIEEAKVELEDNIARVDINKLKLLYNEANELVNGLNKTFEQLVRYHNEMIVEKIRFITSELPEIEFKVNEFNQSLIMMLEKEKIISEKLTNTTSFKGLEIIISELNLSFQQKGEIESTLTQIVEVSDKITELENDLLVIDSNVFSDAFEQNLKDQLIKFNSYFSSVSNELYGEEYGISFEKRKEKKSEKDIYVFDSFNANSSSGKKQGEILCFDLAYITFASDEQLPHLNFTLNDKKELMHGNQLKLLSEFLQDKDIQVIMSILEDKLPSELNNDDYVVLTLSEHDKLFKIES